MQRTADQGIGSVNAALALIGPFALMELEIWRDGAILPGEMVNVAVTPGPAIVRLLHVVDPGFEAAAQTVVVTVVIQVKPDPSKR
jgi:hypothetical protein